MIVRYIGHACIQCQAQDGALLLMDPPASKYGYSLVGVQADYVTVSHNHEDHCAVSLFPNAKVVPRGAEVFQAGPFTIKGVDTFHDNEKGALRGGNRVYRAQADGQSVVHLGDLGHMPDDELLKFAAGADLLVVPVGGVFTLSPEEMVEVIHQMAPAAVLPVHFGTLQGSLKLHTLPEFLALWENPVLQGQGVQLDLAALPARGSGPVLVPLDYTSREEPTGQREGDRA